MLNSSVVKIDDMLSESYDILISQLSAISDPNDIADIIIQSRIRNNASISPFTKEIYHTIKAVATRLSEVANDIQNSL